MSNNLVQHYQQVRQQTLALAQPLSEADMTIQAAEFASPGKWHLAHTTWFFEEFLLQVLGKSWPQSETYRFLFNSYYETIGNRQAQGKRGLITRPALDEVLAYRQTIDKAMLEVLSQGVDADKEELVELGLHHEQQHQELFLTDILYNLAQNPLFPAYQEALPAKKSPQKPNVMTMIPFAGGLEIIGHNGDGFGFDNEFPPHKVYLEPFRLASHLVTNAEWIEFIEDGGYANPLLWLADGWKTVQTEAWQMPLYWVKRDGYFVMSLAGLQMLDLHAPVTNISYFEADAYARWAGKRLPTEAEWEVAAKQQSTQANGGPLWQLYDEVWQWTSSAYSAYPGFKPRSGAVGEYNGKFMNGQYVLRGGSCVSPAGHLRPSYRNFFYPHQRWQFTGLRLVEDAT